MDFTIERYTALLNVLIDAGYQFQSFKEYLENPSSRVIILRHDVDDKPLNSLRFARIQADRNIQGTYYFRVVRQSYNEKVMKEIASMGHEIGYHYETMDSKKGELDSAYQEFCRNLERFRRIVPVSTISMHGSPLSKHDNRDIWKKYSYREHGIIGEPYFDIDFNELYYITDTGRCWDGHLFNVRDKATKENPLTNKQFLSLTFHGTEDLIQAIVSGNFPSKAMINFHPQRWNSESLAWLQELIIQNLKNQVKRVIVKKQR